jgi:hypothetical protein
MRCKRKGTDAEQVRIWKYETMSYFQVHCKNLQKKKRERERESRKSLTSMVGKVTEIRKVTSQTQVQEINNTKTHTLNKLQYITSN